MNDRPARAVVVGSGWDGRLPEGGPWRLWYFGTDYGRRAALSTGLPPDCVEVPVGKALNDVAGRLQPALSRFDGLLATGWSALSWTASDLAERNPYTSDLYSNLCVAIALVEGLRGGGHHLVVVKDDGFGRALAAVCRRAGFAARWLGPGRRPLRRVLQGLRAHAIYLLDWLRQRRALARHPPALRSSAAPGPWLLSWAREDTLPVAAPLAADRFFGPLPGWLRAAGIGFGFLANPMTWMAPIEAIAANMAKAEGPVALVGSFLGPAALLRGYAAWALMPLAVRRSLVLENVDLRPVVRLALAQELASAHLPRAAAYAGLAAGLRKRGIRPSVLFYTYENQPWEKAMLSGFRRCLPETFLVGAQHAPWPDVFPAIYPSEAQWQDGTAPDLLVTIGLEYRDRSIALGAPPGRVAVGGALRFTDLYASAAPVKSTVAQKTNTVLASCSMDVDETVELIHKTALATAGMENLRVIANFHPATGAVIRARVRDRLARLGNWPDIAPHITYVEGAAREWLEQADILLYNASSTCFEATMMGLPTVYVGPRAGLNIDSMLENDELRCYEAGELRRTIERLLDEPAWRQARIDAARHVMQRCFSGPQPEFWVGLAQRAAAGARP